METQYAIKDLERLSGVKAHTLRVWEQRYGILKPKRSDTNIRYYSSEDLKRILNISLLNSNGFKISKIATLPDDEILNQAQIIKRFISLIKSVALLNHWWREQTQTGIIANEEDICQAHTIWKKISIPQEYKRF